ncbi:MAG: hypothetical protein ACI8SR_000931 [Oceanicoccus sp.]|jgi:uncharacterized protein (TIGR02646 family)
MRKLNRPVAPKPLSKYNYNHKEWSDLTARDKKSIWYSLNNMQNGYCCYCDSVAVRGNGHIEHFFNKGTKNYKNLTFNWDNLFGSCGFQSGDTCGHYKDRMGASGPGNYDPKNLIKPDVENPSLFFYFLPTGTIKVNDSLTLAEKARAYETIRVINLDDGALNSARYKRIKTIQKEILNLYSLTQDVAMIKQELAKIRSIVLKGEYQSAVLSALGL